MVKAQENISMSFFNHVCCCISIESVKNWKASSFDSSMNFIQVGISEDILENVFSDFTV